MSWFDKDTGITSGNLKSLNKTISSFNNLNTGIDEITKSLQESTNSIWEEKVRKEIEESKHKKFLEDNSIEQTELLKKIGVSAIDELPKIQELLELRKLIDTDIKTVGYFAGLDRLHTYTSNYLISICNKHSILIKNDRNGNCDIGQTIRNLKNLYISENKIESEMGQMIIGNYCALIQKYNNLRNNNTYAHPSELINELEAQLVTKTVFAILEFIASLEI